MAIAKKPTKAEEPSVTKLEEKKVKEFINLGGSPVKESKPTPEDEDKLKGMVVKLYQSEIDAINEIRNRKPKRDKLSLHDWILEAIKEKIKREK